MEAEARICYYLGANAPTGFYSLYSQLIDPEGARDVRILKGGPGCGKSTLMRQVGAAMEAAGLTVEYIRCSGDPDSLDAVVVPALGAAVVDGTAPHVVEPRYPGLVEHYVDLGACYDPAGLRQVAGELKGCMKGYKACYNRAYRPDGGGPAAGGWAGNSAHPRPGGQNGQAGPGYPVPGVQKSGRSRRQGGAALPGGGDLAGSAVRVGNGGGSVRSGLRAGGQLWPGPLHAHRPGRRSHGGGI